jgi:DNA transposition AAA+ family ATPase
MERLWTDAEKQAVREWAAWCERKELSRTQQAKLLRVSAATLSQMLSFTYAGRADRIVEQMKREVRRWRLEAVAPAPPPYATTSVTEEVVHACAVAHIEHVIVLILGGTGIGKTMGIRRYCEAEPDTILITAGVGCSPWSIEQLLAARLGIAWHGSVAHMRNQIAETLRGSGRLLIVDEIDYVNEPTLQCLRMIHDAAQVGLVLVGTGAYLRKLRARKSATIGQVLGRIRAAIQLDGCSADDLAAILKPFAFSDDALDAVVEGAGGQARRAVACAIAAKRLNGKEITAETVRQAYASLMPLE